MPGGKNDGNRPENNEAKPPCPMNNGALNGMRARPSGKWPVILRKRAECVSSSSRRKTHQHRCRDFLSEPRLANSLPCTIVSEYSTKYSKGTLLNWHREIVDDQGR